MASGPSLIKDLKNGNSFCQLCSMQFKTKTLTAHVNGRKHREAVSQLKQKDNNSQRNRTKEEEAAAATTPIEDRAREKQQTGGLKRKHPPEDDAFDSFPYERVEEENVFNGRPATVPWQAEVKDAEKREGSAVGGAHVIEGLPKGFFDDEQMNSRVRETIEKQKQITSEIDKFYKEVEELEAQREDEREEMNEQWAIRSDIEKIDEQIERWKMVNELEKKKETIVDSVTTKFEQAPNFDRVEMADDDDDESVDIVDFDKINWRTKAF